MTRKREKRWNYNAGNLNAMFNLLELQTQHNFRIRGAIHVGAHKGEEIAAYEASGTERVLLVEANETLHQELLDRRSDVMELRVIHAAATNYNGEAVFHIANNDMSSSLLPMARHGELYPGIGAVARCVVPARSLDDLLAEAGAKPGDYNFLNLDIQGAELMALQGALATLPDIDWIICEVSKIELYEGAPLAEDIVDFLACHGFRLLDETYPYSKDWGDMFFGRL